MTPTLEQLELAAKAAGLDLRDGEEYPSNWDFLERGIELEDGRWWNPITDKLDSFDLMIAGEINIQHLAELGRVFAGDGSTLQMEEYKDHATEADATMWAIFLCAVEIGRDM